MDPVPRYDNVLQKQACDGPDPQIAVELQDYGTSRRSIFLKAATKHKGL